MKKNVVRRNLCLLTNKLFKKFPVSGRESMESYVEMEFRGAKRALELYKPYHSIENKYILDVGCGMGGASVYYALDGAKKVIGIDIDEKRINTASSFASLKGLNNNTSFEVRDACNLPYRSSTFDMIISNATFEHLYKPDMVLKECNRVLKEEGILNFTFMPYRSRRGAHLYDYVYMPWCQLFFPDEVLVKIWKEGFKKAWETGENKSESFSPEEIENTVTVRNLQHLNMIKIKELKKIVAETDFRIVLWRTYESKYFYLLKYVPFVNEYCIDRVVAVLQKRTEEIVCQENCDSKEGKL